MDFELNEVAGGLHVDFEGKEIVNYTINGK